jgi:hypothetical protein
VHRACGYVDNSSPVAKDDAKEFLALRDISGARGPRSAEGRSELSRGVRCCPLLADAIASPATSDS